MDAKSDNLFESTSRRRVFGSSIFCIGVVLLLASVVSFAGIQWLSRNTKEVRITEFSPDGNRFLCSEYDRRTGRDYDVEIRDAQTGKTQFTLSGFQWQRDSLRWSPDGQYLVGIDESQTSVLPNPSRQRVVVLRVTDQLETISQTRIDNRKRVFEVLFNDEGRVVQVQRERDDTGLSRDPTSRFKLEFVIDGTTLLGELECGRAEFNSVLPTQGRNPIAILFCPNRRYENIISNGTEYTLCHIDPSTADIIRYGRVSHFQGAKAGYTSFDLSRPEFIYRSCEDNKTRVFRDSHMQTPILAIDHGSKHGLGVVSISQTRFVCIRNDRLVVADLGAGAERTLAIPKRKSLTPTPDGKIMLSTRGGGLSRVDLDTGTIEVIVGTRLIRFFYRPIALFGVPLIWGVAFYMSKGKSRNPFIEMILLLLLTTLVLLSWSILGVESPAADMVTFHVGCTAVGSLVLFCLASTLTLRSWFTALAGKALSFGLFAAGISAWAYGGYLFGQPPQGESFGAAFGYATGKIVYGWVFLSLGLFRLAGGRLTRSGEANTKGSKQFRLRQLSQVIPIVAIFLVVARFCFESQPEFSTMGGTYEPIWEASVVSLSILATVVAAFWLNRLSLSFLLLSAMLSCVLVGQWLFSRVIPIRELGLETIQIFVVSVSGILWICFRYCRAHGFRLVRTPLTRHGREQQHTDVPIRPIDLAAPVDI